MSSLGDDSLQEDNVQASYTPEASDHLDICWPGKYTQISPKAGELFIQKA